MTFECIGSRCEAGRLNLSDIVRAVYVCLCTYSNRSGGVKPFARIYYCCTTNVANSWRERPNRRKEKERNCNGNYV